MVDEGFLNELAKPGADGMASIEIAVQAADLSKKVLDELAKPEADGMASIE